MQKLFLLGSSSSKRPTNTVQHANDLWLEQSASYEYCTSNKKAVEELLKSDSQDALALIPFYNLYWSSVRDTLEWIWNAFHRIKILSVTKMKIEYLLVCPKWNKKEDITTLGTHVQSFHQTSASQLDFFWRWLEHFDTGTTSWGIDYIYNCQDSDKLKKYAWAIAPHQFDFQSDGDRVDVLSDNFWPKNNYTYFILISLLNWWNWVSIDIPDDKVSHNHWCDVMNIPDKPGSLYAKLCEIDTSWRDVLWLVSLEISDQQVEFVYTYSTLNMTSDGSSNNFNQATRLSLMSHRELPDGNEFSATMQILPKKGSLKSAVWIFAKHNFDIREIHSSPTWYKTIDFHLKFKDLWDNWYTTEERVYLVQTEIGMQKFF
jgi:prephenate dehydratase